MRAESEVRNLVVILGDQLNRDAAAFDRFDGAHDLVWMAEVAEESTYVWSSKQRIAMFLAAMRHFAEGYLAVYADAVEWVELPNTLGMSQYADGGLMASKPYAATGKYIDRMSDYCRGCRYDPAARTGDAACPFTTLYWDFLARHEQRLAKNPRMALQLKNVGRLAAAERATIAERAARILAGKVGAA